MEGKMRPVEQKALILSLWGGGHLMQFFYIISPSLNLLRYLDFSFLLITHQIKLEWWQYLTQRPQNKRLRKAAVQFLYGELAIFQKKKTFDFLLRF